MKFTLYILLFSLLHSISSEEKIEEEEMPKDKYDILPYDKFDTDDISVIDGRNKFPAAKFNGPNVHTLPIADVNLSNTTLSSPFILYTVFFSVDTSCIFSIVDKGVVKLSLCFTQVDATTEKIDLYVNGKEVMNFKYGGSFKDWTEMLLHIEDATITLYFDDSCDPFSIIEANVEDIYFSSDAVVNYGNNDKVHFFKGGVEAIKIFTDTDYTPAVVLNCTDDEEPPGGLDSIKGEKGEKGDKGDSITGPPGPNGPQGPPGDKGDTGTCSCSESVVSSLLRSMPEMRGPKGDQGAKGAMGDIGDPGIMGKQGDKGERGSEGLRGKPGETGEVGAPGNDGAPGLKGEPGKIGERGLQGPIGLPGLPGPPGEAYKEIDMAKEVPVPGEKGDIGPLGPPGKLGEKGEKGQQGLKGEKGDKGHHGHEGPQGDRGEQGETGPRGPSGEPGTHGKPGIQGDKGERGDKGSPGLPGLPASLLSLLDPDMDPVKNAEIVKKLRGHEGEIGHKGDKGDTGDAGPEGPPGSPGKDGRHGSHGKTGPKGDMGPRGYKGESGQPGPPGNISQSEITLMKGPKGDTGSPGSPGKVGARGPPGHRGTNGAPGPAGPMGPKGDIGATGPQGKTGSTGDKGEKGESVLSSIDSSKLKGEKGDRGNDGNPGKDGGPGSPGKCTDSCKPHVVSGPPGPPGPPGSPGHSVIGPKGEPGGIISEKTFYSVDGNHNHETLLDDDDDYYSPMTIVFRTVTALIKHTPSTPLGTLAYVLREKTLLLRVENGWQYVVMGSLIDTRTTTTTYRPPPIRIVEGSPTKRSPTDSAFIRLIALNEPYAGNMLYSNNKTGRTAANNACYNQARHHRVEGNFVAFLSNEIEDLRNLVKIVKDRSMPVVNVHEEALFRSWQDMFNGSGALLAKSANIYSFNGKNVFIDPTWPRKAVWHGGDIYGIRSPEAFCEEWQSNSPYHVGLASTLPKLLRHEKFSCNSKLIVLCVETTASKRRQRHPEWRQREHRRARTSRLNRL